MKECMENITNYTLKIAKSVQETENDFILTTILPYCNSIHETIIPKELLKRAINSFRDEHNAEYEYLMKEAMDRQ